MAHDEKNFTFGVKNGLEFVLDVNVMNARHDCCYFWPNPPIFFGREVQQGLVPFHHTEIGGCGRQAKVMVVVDAGAQR
jgi:hypothetical protein